MADPLSIVVAAASLAGGTVKASIAITEFVRNVQSASDDLGSISKELQALRGVLESLGSSLSQARDSEKLPDNLLRQIGDTLDGCDTVIKKITDNIANYQRTHIWTKATWIVFGQEDFRKLREGLEAYKMALSLGLHAIAMSINVSIKDDTEAIRVKVDEVLEVLARGKSIPHARWLHGQRKVETWIEEMAVLSSYGESTYQATIADSTEYAEEDSLSHRIASWQASDPSHTNGLGEDDPNTLVNVHNLAETYGRRGQDKEAKALYAKVVEARKGVLGQDHVDTLDSMHNRATGRHKEAETLDVQVAEAGMRPLGQDHVDTLDNTHTLTMVHQDQGRHKEAESLYVQVVEERKRALGQDHADTLRSMHSLAMVFQDQGQHKEAEALYAQVVETRKRVLGQEHVDTLQSMHNLAMVYRDQGRHKEAAALYAQVVEAEKRVLGQDHASTLLSMHDLALVYRDQGRHKEAEALYAQVIEARKRVLGQDHVDTLKCMHNLATVYRDQGRHKEAEALYAQVVKARKRVLGQDHVRTLYLIEPRVVAF